MSVVGRGEEDYSGGFGHGGATGYGSHTGGAGMFGASSAYSHYPGSPKLGGNDQLLGINTNEYHLVRPEHLQNSPAGTYISYSLFPIFLFLLSYSYFPIPIILFLFPYSYSPIA